MAIQKSITIIESLLQKNNIKYRKIRSGGFGQFHNYQIQVMLDWNKSFITDGLIGKLDFLKTIVSDKFTISEGGKGFEVVDPKTLNIHQLTRIENCKRTLNILEFKEETITKLVNNPTGNYTSLQGIINIFKTSFKGKMYWDSGTNFFEFLENLQELIDISNENLAALNQRNNINEKLVSFVSANSMYFSEEEKTLIDRYINSSSHKRWFILEASKEFFKGENLEIIRKIIKSVRKEKYKTKLVQTEINEFLQNKKGKMLHNVIQKYVNCSYEGIKKKFQRLNNTNAVKKGGIIIVPVDLEKQNIKSILVNSPVYSFLKRGGDVGKYKLQLVDYYEAILKSYNNENGDILGKTTELIRQLADILGGFLESEEFLAAVKKYGTEVLFHQKRICRKIIDKYLKSIGFDIEEIANSLSLRKGTSSSKDKYNGIDIIMFEGKFKSDGWSNLIEDNTAWLGQLIIKKKEGLNYYQLLRHKYLVGVYASSKGSTSGKLKTRIKTRIKDWLDDVADELSFEIAKKVFNLESSSLRMFLDNENPGKDKHSKCSNHAKSVNNKSSCANSDSSPQEFQRILKFVKVNFQEGNRFSIARWACAKSQEKGLLSSAVNSRVLREFLFANWDEKSKIDSLLRYYGV